MKIPYIVIALLIIGGCTEIQEEPLPDLSEGVPIEEISKDLESEPEVKVEKNDSVPLITGSCKGGKPIGDRSEYIHKMIIGPSESGWETVKSDATCFDPNPCPKRKLLGKIKSGTIVYATNSVKARNLSSGAGYAFLVRDSNGDTSRVYLGYKKLTHQFSQDRTVNRIYQNSTRKLRSN